jgi:tetratricopeptide (TPR) repeat protein
MEDKTTDNAGSSGAEPLVKRGYLFLEDSDWNKADEYFDKALDANPEYAPAYIGKLCAELRVRREDSLGNYQELRQGKMLDKPLEKYGHFQKALRFADDACRNKLNGYEQKIKDSFPKKIPQQFTDEFINGEIAKLEKEIAACDKIINFNKGLHDNAITAVNELLAQQRKVEKDKKDLNDAYTAAWVGAINSMAETFQKKYDEFKS